MEVWTSSVAHLLMADLSLITFVTESFSWLRMVFVHVRFLADCSCPMVVLARFLGDTTKRVQFVLVRSEAVSPRLQHLLSCRKSYNTSNRTLLFLLGKSGIVWSRRGSVIGKILQVSAQLIGFSETRRLKELHSLQCWKESDNTLQACTDYIHGRLCLTPKSNGAILHITTRPQKRRKDLCNKIWRGKYWLKHILMKSCPNRQIMETLEY